MKYDLVIFDLDGTLLDTLEDLAGAANTAMARFGFPPRSLDDIRRFIGNGVVWLIRQCAPEGTPDEVIQAALAEFKIQYAQHVNDRTRAYPGVTDLLRALRNAGLHTAVNSNKMDAAVQRLCSEHFGALIETALGEKHGIPKKPAPDGALYLMRAFDAAAERTIYVGDGETDLQTARAAGIDSIWVSWGFRKREELADLNIRASANTVEQLRRLILG